MCFGVIPTYSPINYINIGVCSYNFKKIEREILKQERQVITLKLNKVT